MQIFVGGATGVFDQGHQVATVSGFTGGDTGGYQAVKTAANGGGCVVMKHAPIGSSSPEFRFHLGGN